MPPKKVKAPQQENVQLGPAVREGELVFGVARIFASMRIYNFVAGAMLIVTSRLQRHIRAHVNTRLKLGHV